MPNSPSDALKMKVFKLPKEVRIEIDKMILDENLGAHAILTRMSLFHPEWKELLPGTNALHGYVQWRRENPTVYAVYLQDTKVINTPVNNTVNVVDSNSTVDALNIDLSSGKDVLEMLKRSLMSRIQMLELNQKNGFDKYTEQTLAKYYDQLRQLVHSDVKLAEELKDSDKISVADVRNSIGKLFSAVYMVVDRLFPGNKDNFKEELVKVIKFYQSSILDVEEDKTQAVK